MNCRYRLFVPKQAVGANLVYFDMFNATDNNIVLKHVHPIVSGAVAVVGTLGIDLFLTRTTAIGTGGTAATRNGTALDAATISSMNIQDVDADASITARLTPTGGATAGAVLTWMTLFTEETSAAAYMGKMTAMLNGGDEVVIPPQTGFRVVQGAVASVGNIGFDIGFDFHQ